MQYDVTITDILSAYEETFLAYSIESANSKTVICENTLAITGHKHELLLLDEFFDTLIHPNDLSAYLDFINGSTPSKISRIKFRLKTRKGDYLTVCNNRYNFNDKNDHTTCLHILYKDTALNYLEEENGLISYQRYQTLIDSVNEIIFQTDNDGNWTFLNKSWTMVMGYELSEVLGKPFFNYLHPDDVEKNFKLFTPLIENKKEYCSHEIRYISRSGTIIWIDVYAILLKDELGNVIGTSGTLRDITRDKENRDMLQLLSNNINDLVCIHETDGRYKYISPSIKALTGYQPEELIGQQLLTYLHPEDIERVLENQQYFTDLDTFTTQYVEYRFRVKNGDYVWFEANSRSIHDNNNKMIGIVTSSRVIDIRKQAEENILNTLHKERELNQLKSNFVNLASHEFRTPLACIRSSLELLELSASRSQNPLVDIARHANNIFTEVDRLSMLIDEVLTVGKIESSSFSCKKEAIIIDDLIKDKIKELEAVQPDGRKIKIISDEYIGQVMNDPLLMGLVLSNLISNAFKYSTGSKEPELKLSSTKSSYTIKIKDFGIGIPFDQQSKIFQAFYRAENVIGIKGTGLGMFITKYFIELHKGTLKFKSIPEKGTEFIVTLPKK
jgi:PAS domain S-box-containing protein